MKIAIVHDWFLTYRGSERQLKYISNIFPQADLFFLMYDHKLVRKMFGAKAYHIKSSFLNRFPFKNKIYPFLLPLTPAATESLDLSKYDLVITSSSNAVKGVITRPDACHICNLYTPTRYIWDQYSGYLGTKSNSSFFTKMIGRKIAYYFRIWDKIASARPDCYISISNYVAKRIKKYYHRDSTVIYPGVELPNYNLGLYKSNFYVHVTSFEPNKNTELVIETFNRNGEELNIIGSTGRLSRKILKQAKPNIKFLGWVDGYDKFTLFGEAKAVIIPGVEDFGIVSIEAQHMGTPAIGYNKGGLKETVDKKFLFNENTVESLQAKLNEVEAQKVDGMSLRRKVKRFSVDNFKNNFKKFVTLTYENWN